MVRRPPEAAPVPLAACPSCATALRVPDGSAAAVRCPKCRTVFSPAAGPSPPPAPPPSRPAFGSGVRPAPPPPPALPAGGSRPPLAGTGPPPPPKRPPVILPPRPAGRPRPAPEPEPEFEAVDADPTPEPETAFSFDDPPDRRPRKARLLDDPDDDRPRRAALADDEDDRPRKRRGRGRPRDEEYDDGDDDWYDGPGRRNPYRPAAVGSLLLAISLWIYLGVFGTLALLVLVLWAGGDPPEALLVLAGAAGLGNWVLGGVGLGFLMAGPKKARGVTTAAVVLAAVHLLIMVLVAADLFDSLRVLAALGVGSRMEVLYAFITLLPFVDTFLPVLFYSNKMGAGRVPGEFFVLVLGGACEIARLILVTLALGAHGRAAKDYEAADRARIGVTGVAWTCGGAAVLFLVVILIVVEGKLVKSARPLGGVTLLLIFVGYSLMLIFPALTAHAARAGLLRKARKADKAGREDW